MKFLLNLALLFCVFSFGAALCAEEPQNFLNGSPAVFAVENTYQIMVRTKANSLVRIKVGDTFYTDHINGIRPSECEVHRFTIPARELENAGKYAVYTQTLPERLPYLHLTKLQPEHHQVFEFKKLPQDNIRIFNISDVHGRVKQAVAAAAAAGKFDLLILNGDLIENSAQEHTLTTALQLAGDITRGTIPVIYARGNHEMRGKFAEKLSQYTPLHRGKNYYLIECGPIFAVVMDAGEDKQDSHPAYGNTLACDEFRLEQLEFLNSDRVKKAFASAGNKYRLVISHVPFPRFAQPGKKIPAQNVFPVFARWSASLKENFAPQLIICGHLHYKFVDNKPHYLAPVVVGATVNKKTNYVSGCLITLSKKQWQVKFLSQEGKVEKVVNSTAL